MKKNSKENTTVTVMYALDGETKGTHKYVALNADDKPVTDTNERLDVGSNIIYVLKSVHPKAPKTIKAVFTLDS